MIQGLPTSVSLIFGATTLLTVWIFFLASGRNKWPLILIGAWLIFQSFIAMSGFYLKTDTLPPRMVLLIALPLLTILWLFLSAKGKQFIDGLDIRLLTMLHVVRIPVELVLFWLFQHGDVPQLMTFEGRNFDILSGITSPIIYYFCFVKGGMGKNVLLMWNMACLGLLLNIVINAVLSVPTVLQRFAFEQPNTAVLHFPFVWLPCCVVPLVLLSHLTSIRGLLNRKDVIS